MALVANGTTLASSELATLDGVTAGTATASKVLIVDGSKDITLGTGDLTATTGTFAGTLGVTGHITATTGTFSGNLDTADNARLRLGNGSDLQIWHDGSNSYVSDSGTGDLHIEAADNLWISNISGEKYINSSWNHVN